MRFDFYFVILQRKKDVRYEEEKRTDSDRQKGAGVCAH